MTFWLKAYSVLFLVGVYLGFKSSEWWRTKVPIGTKTLLVGYHAFWLHPFFVAHAWKRLFPREPRTWRHWLCFFVHDLGYWGKPDLDGVFGKNHPFLGAYMAHKWCDGPDRASCPQTRFLDCEWAGFCLFHSRDMARAYQRPVSRLCWPDKLAFNIYPKWLVKALFWASGELEQYLSNPWAKEHLDQGKDFEEWYSKVIAHNAAQIEEGMKAWK